MSETPIYDITRATLDASHSAGNIEGRNSMRLEILELANAIPRPSAQLLKLIQQIDKLDIRRKTDHGTTR